jgi:hypothetical protein
MHSRLKIFTSVLIGAVFTACHTTGDPTQGGIFWSEHKAKERLEEKQARLEKFDADVLKVHSSNRNLEKSVARKQKHLGE